MSERPAFRISERPATTQEAGSRLFERRPMVGKPLQKFIERHVESLLRLQPDATSEEQIAHRSERLAQALRAELEGKIMGTEHGSMRERLYAARARIEQLEYIEEDTVAEMARVDELLAALGEGTEEAQEAERLLLHNKKAEIQGRRNIAMGYPHADAIRRQKKLLNMYRKYRALETYYKSVEHGAKAYFEHLLREERTKKDEKEARKVAARLESKARSARRTVRALPRSERVDVSSEEINGHRMSVERKFEPAVGTVREQEGSLSNEEARNALKDVTEEIILGTLKGSMTRSLYQEALDEFISSGGSMEDLLDTLLTSVTSLNPVELAALQQTSEGEEDHPWEEFHAKVVEYMEDALSQGIDDIDIVILMPRYIEAAKKHIEDARLRVALNPIKMDLELLSQALKA